MTTSALVLALSSKTNAPEKSLRTQTAALRHELCARLAALDERWQQYVHSRIDPLLGGERSQQLDELNVQVGDAEKEINRRLLISAANIGLAVTAGLGLAVAAKIFWPLAAVSVGVNFWLAVPFYLYAYRAMVDERRLTYPAVLFISEVGILFSGQIVALSLGMPAILVAEKVAKRSESHFRRNVTDALGKQPKTVWLVVDGVEVEKPVTDVRIGDRIAIGGGETIAVDGLIVAGAAMIDEHRLTGEAHPAEKTVGDTVLASSVVLSGKIQVEVQKTGQETSAAQIAGILEQASRVRLAFNSRVQNFVDGMTLPMLGLGGVTWLALGTESAASILGVGVGSVARFGGPIVMLNYLNVAARHGVLIKDARSFELLKKVDTIIFDKTGTLTLERPHVSGIHLLPGWNGEPMSEDRLLFYAAAAEARQSHPIARAIMHEVHARGVATPAVEDAHLEMGYGVKVHLPLAAAATGAAPLVPGPSPLASEQVIHVGSSRYMEMEGIHVPPATLAVLESCHTQGHALVMVAVDGKLAGAIELQPTVRPEARAAITELREQGYALYIISGDHQTPTRQMAESLGIEHYYADVLPQDKAGLVEQLKADGRRVCFVGDGINDALALGKADVSVSLRGASTLATDTAQVVLMSQDLRQLASLFQLATEFNNFLDFLFRVTLVPVGAVIASTYLLHTGIYAATVIWQMAMLSGIGLGFLPLLRHPTHSEDGTPRQITSA